MGSPQISTKSSIDSRKSPAALGEAEIRAFLLHLIKERQAKPATVRKNPPVAKAGMAAGG